MNCGVIALENQSDCAVPLLKYIFEKIGVYNFKEPEINNYLYLCNNRIKKVMIEEEFRQLDLTDKSIYYCYYIDKDNENTLQIIIMFDKLTLKQMKKLNKYYLGFFELKYIEISKKKMELSKNINKKKRNSVEYNGTELSLALLLLYPEIICHESLIQKVIEFKQYIQSDNKRHSDERMNRIKINKISDIDGYLQDIMKSEKIKIYNKFISNYHGCILNSSSFDFTTEEINCIFISGKKNTHTEISELNKEFNHLETKSDIYVKLYNSKFVGISVKQSNNATKSNYSVQKMLGKENDKLLTNIRKEYLHSCGFEKMDKSKRDEMNKLFYRTSIPNKYWEKLRELIAENKNNIVNKLVSALYCENLNYDIYEFNGTSIIKLNDIKNKYTSISFEEHEPYYYDNNGNERKTAKLFYRLDVNGVIYRVEIRWKGNIYNTSPQFQIHEEY